MSVVIEACARCERPLGEHDTGTMCAACGGLSGEWLASRKPGGEKIATPPRAEVISLTSLFSQRTWPDPLRAEALHGPAGEFVRIVAPESEADPAALLFTFLAAVGNALGDGPHAYVEGARHPARLFTVIVGKTSQARKGTSWRRVREPLLFAFNDYKDRVADGLSSGEGLIQRVRDADPADERADHEENRDRRLLVVEGEFAGPLRAASRSGSILSVVLRNLWDSGDVQTLTRHNPLKASGAHVSVVGHITMEELSAEWTATDTANGLANRILWACSERSQMLPDGGNLDFRDLMPVCQALERAADWAKASRRLGRDGEAAELWRSVYADLTADRAGAFGKATSRAEAQVLRLSVLYAALDSSSSIGVDHLRAALAVWKYAEDSAGVIFHHSTGDHVADRIVRALKSKPEGMTKTEITNLFDRHLPADQITRALALLGGAVEVEKVGTGGRPVERVRLREKSEVSEKRPLA